MSLQLIGSRLLAPHFGNSIFVWTSLIGVMLGFMALGNVIGGRLADRKNSPDLLFLVLLLLSVSISLVAMVGGWALGALAGIESMRTGMVLGSVILFAIPCVLFGMVLPASIRLRMQAVTDSGANIGGLSAISMMGNIAGTFATGFWLIAAVGSRSLLAWIALLILFLATLMGLSLRSRQMNQMGDWWQGGRRQLTNSRKLLALGVAAAFVIAAFVWQPTHASLQEFRVFDTLYDQYFVGEQIMPSRTIDMNNDIDPALIDPAALSRSAPEMRPVRFLANSPRAMESAIYLDTMQPYFFEYYAYYNLAAAAAPGLQDAGNVLMIGGGAFVYPRFFFQQYPQARMDVVEIDSRLLDEAQENFAFVPPHNMNIYLEDGRMFLNRNARAARQARTLSDAGAVYNSTGTTESAVDDGSLYDLVIIDAFTSANNVPFQLTTLQSMQHCYDLLSDDGILVMNLIASVEGEGSQFLASQYLTLREVFPQVEVYVVRAGEIEPGAPRNVAIIAAKNPRMNLGSTLRQIDPQLTSRHISADALRATSSAMVLTDDFAPVDQMLISVNR